MTDISSGIQGSFNQANLASRRAEAEEARTRRSQDERIRDARRRFITAQEEVQEARDLQESRVEPDKENTRGQDAWDQYVAHDELTADAKAPKRDADDHERRHTGDDDAPPDVDSGHLIDIEA